jgi:hypothetical protein
MTTYELSHTNYHDTVELPLNYKVFRRVMLGGLDSHLLDDADH